MKKQQPPRILIIKLSSLGDLFHALPTVHVLRQELQAEIDWVTQPEYAGLVRHFDDVSHVLSFPRRNLRTQWKPFLEELRSREYDYVIDLQGLMKSALIGAAARGAEKIGPSGAREGAHLLYHATAGRKNKARHAAEELLDVARHLNLPLPDSLCFPVTFPPAEALEPGLHIALCPVSRAAGKNWPADRFAQTAAGLLEDYPDAHFHLVGAPADRPLCEQVATKIGDRAINHAGQTSLLELGSLLSRMDLLITVDSGPMHMAAAIGTPTLALFGPTAPLRTGPYGKMHRVIESPFQSDKKRISKKIRQRDMRYMEAIPVDRVRAEAARMLEKNRSDSK